MISLPNDKEIPNQCFWFNYKFIKEIVSDLLKTKNNPIIVYNNWIIFCYANLYLHNQLDAQEILSKN